MEGISPGRLEAWFETNVSESRPPFRYERVSGGRSNLTYRVTDAAGQTWALRRPPLGPRLPSAHDMSREHRIISALVGSTVPVATPRGFCEDEMVTGAPFYVMDFLPGPILRSVEDAEELVPQAARWALTENVVSTLAAIHALDPETVGLGQLGRQEGYVERQLNRWMRQWDAGSGDGDEGRLVGALHRRLLSDIPAQGSARIVHGDFRLDNLILDDTANEVAAVVDWELCTLGDPLADLGLLIVYWAQAEDSVLPLGSAPSLAPGFPSRSAVANLYAQVSGRDISRLNFYVAFGYWKLAIILHGVAQRYGAGQYGKSETEAEAELVGVVGALLEKAESALG